jgi:two-component system alkaline phosphatase synthesis response regulator PhoP
MPASGPAEREEVVMARILVVDDDEDVCELVRMKLEASGHVVRVERDGLRAVQALHEEQLLIDVVLLDWMMPVVDGETACRALRADPRTAVLPVLMLSARGQSGDAARGLQAGADGYIVKPFSPRELAAKVDAAVELGRARTDVGS